MLKLLKKLWALDRKTRFLKYSRHQIETAQWRKLKAVITHAYTTVPYYRDLFSRHHLKPADINGFQDLKKIPLTSKQDILTLGRSRITSDAVAPGDCHEMRTSGSTGEPFRFYETREYGEKTGLDCIRSKRVHGMKLTDRILRIGGGETNTRIPSRLYKRVFMRKITMSSFSKPEKILEQYNRLQPNVIRGFLSNLYMFALWLDEHRIRLTHSPRFVLCSAEMAHDFMREKISEVFQAKVIDRYATAELGVVADNCDHGQGYHVFEDSVYPEFVEVNGVTCFVGTNLDNYATPFIRYNTMDVCTPFEQPPGRCTCGLNTIKFEKISGRDNDFIRTWDGRVLAPMQFIFFMRKKYRCIKQFRMVQRDDRTIRVELVPAGEINKATCSTMASGLRTLTGGLEPDIQILDHIPLEKSGKMRIVKSYVARRGAHAN